jgi:hypothetical protein
VVLVLLDKAVEDFLGAEFLGGLGFVSAARGRKNYRRQK